MLKKIIDFLFSKGFSFKVKKDWPGEKNLPQPNKWDPDVSDKTIQKEIQDSLNKEKNHG